MTSNQKVRVRFAPSPTGFFHIGGARTALFNWLYARHTGGDFVLRIEDTDEERNTPEALDVILDGMRWLGLDWDEGPGVGGSFGPYIQSERSGLYREYIDRLEAAGRAYSKDGAIYFKVSGEPQEIEDAVRGKVVRREEKDFVIVRSNGKPVFHLVVVVDDISMGITHVIRGEDHLSNTSKHTELFKALGAPLPRFAHIPLILKANGPGKMSKRDTGFLVEDYQQRDFLPEAVRNYLCLLGWSPKDDSEILSRDELIARFDLPGIIKDSARFDERKLVFVNTGHLRGLSIEKFTSLARPVLERAGTIHDRVDTEYLESVLTLCQEKIRTFPELSDYVHHFFNEDFPIDGKAQRKLFKRGDPCRRLEELIGDIAMMAPFSDTALEDTVKRLAEKHEVYTGEYIHPVRLAVTGTSAGPGLYSLMQVLGRERCLVRIRRFLEIVKNREE